jgi:hypothetical protein
MVTMVAALTLAGVACGGDDDGDVTDDAGAASEGDDSGDDAGSGSEWCDLARGLDSNTLFEDIEFDNADSLEETYDEILDLLDDAGDAAPDEIKADFEILIESSKELVTALADVDYDFAKVDQTILENPEAEAASARVEAYNDRVCGIDTDFDDTDDTIDLGDTGDLDIGDIDQEALRDQMVTVFSSMGMTEEQANCVFDNIDVNELEDAGNVDPSVYFDLFAECGFDITNPQPDG